MVEFENPQFQYLPSEKAPEFTVPQAYLNVQMPLPAAWDYHAENNSSHPLFIYENGPGDIKTITWRQGSNATHRAARLVRTVVPAEVHRPVVGILAVKDPITYWAVFTGIIRAGFICFVISPRNSAPAVNHLLKATNCTTLFVSKDSAMQSLAKSASESLEQPPSIVPMPDYQDMFMDNERDLVRLPPFNIPDMNLPAVICHSSGTTSFPKPISINHRNLCIISLYIHTGTPEDARLAGKIGMAHSSPLFHLIGITHALGMTTSTGLILNMLKPADPPIQATPESILESMISTQCQHAILVPSILDAWAQDPEVIAKLKTIPDLQIAWGGGPLSEAAGEILAENGITFNTVYGTSEALGMGRYSGENRGKDWQYFEQSPYVDFYFEPYENNLFKVNVLSSKKFIPNVINCTKNGIPAFDTNDLVTPHPTKKGFWRIVGRADDQIMHSTGEKTNPGPLEHIIRRHPLIKGCLMFGREQFQAGVIIEPIDAKLFDPQDHEKLAAFRNEIWPIIEEANAFAPQHSRIFKEMIIVTDPSRPLLTTDKRTTKRQPNLNAYEFEIKAAYEAIENSARQDVDVPTTWDLQSVTKFIREVVLQVLRKGINDTDDIFQKGGDSLQATAIRNSISRAMRDSNKSVSKLGQNLIYKYPTIQSLASFIYEITSNNTSNGVSGDVTVMMQEMVREFTQAFPTHKPSKHQPASETVLVTGTTGSLGCYLLDKLVSTESIRRVYALNRADKLGKQSLLERQKIALIEQGVDPAILNSPKLVLLEGDINSVGFGLSNDMMEEIVGSVTSIIHNAWRVDFNLSLPSFKPFIQGVRNLIDMSLGSPFPKPPQITFVSSVGTLTGWSEQRAVPEHVLTDPKIAAGGGYGESKWVAEQILVKANEMTPTHNVVIRLGQVCGNTRNGNWNVWEWFPAMVQSYKAVHCLPVSKGVVTWVPTDAVASAVVDMRSSDWPYLHIVHPKPVPMSSIMEPIARSLGVPLVPVSKWVNELKKIRAAQETSSRNDAVKAAADIPALKLVDFYAGAAVADDSIVEGHRDMEAEAFFGTRLETVHTVKVSKTMAELPMLGEKDAEIWLSYWKKKNVL